eukprot:TRINITY_DN3047_c0_g4_i1.p1 TRINITY_DN3047_c0_g4~~TRINITY_DN3047_c0_g4_i1.p1  ORF type:complete len:469 (+),score=68.82 TRINITY_DN3047_c0_g4_i1:204-1409(+)
MESCETVWPFYVTIQIFEFLDDVSFSKCKGVCKFWYNVARKTPPRPLLDWHTDCPSFNTSQSFKHSPSLTIKHSFFTKSGDLAVIFHNQSNHELRIVTNNYQKGSTSTRILSLLSYYTEPMIFSNHMVTLVNRSIDSATECHAFDLSSSNPSKLVHSFDFQEEPTQLQVSPHGAENQEMFFLLPNLGTVVGYNLGNKQVMFHPITKLQRPNDTFFSLKCKFNSKTGKMEQGLVFHSTSFVLLEYFKPRREAWHLIKDIEGQELETFISRQDPSLSCGEDKVVLSHPTPVNQVLWVGDSVYILSTDNALVQYEIKKGEDNFVAKQIATDIEGEKRIFLCEFSDRLLISSKSGIFEYQSSSGATSKKLSLDKKKGAQWSRVISNREQFSLTVFNSQELTLLKY